VVTGANRGLGLETSRQLVQLGIQVVLTSRSNDKGRTAVEQFKNAGLEVRFHALDVTDPAAVTAFAHFVEQEYGLLDIQVNSAGVFSDPYDSSNPDVSSIFNAEIDTTRTSQET
jgi:NAD(P)-dependent dehydrogenase (short-subunit alcohol dehydrogenase family)